MIELRNSVRSLVRGHLLFGCIAIAVVGRLAIAAPLNGASAEAPNQTLYLQKSVDFVPVVTVERGSDKVLEFAFSNNTTEPIKFFPEARFGFGWLNIDFIRDDGKRIPYCVFVDWAASKEHIKTLQPGDTTPIRVSLHEFGLEGKPGNIPPGRYQIRAVSSGVSQYGSTPLKIDRTIMLIEIRAADSALTSPLVRLVAIMTVTAILGAGWWLLRKRRAVRDAQSTGDGAELQQTRGTPERKQRAPTG
jgi:hypothetical protein